MVRAELRMRVVLAQKDFGIIHTGHPAPHNKLLRTIFFESTQPTELIRDPRVMPLPVRRRHLLYAAWRHRPNWCRQGPPYIP
jgi:hypothetical protein